MVYLSKHFKRQQIWVDELHAFSNVYRLNLRYTVQVNFND